MIIRSKILPSSISIISSPTNKVEVAKPPALIETNERQASHSRFFDSDVTLILKKTKVMPYMQSHKSL